MLTIGPALAQRPRRIACWGTVLAWLAFGAFADTSDAAVLDHGFDKLERANRVLKATEKRAWPEAYEELSDVPEMHGYVVWQHLLDKDTDFGFRVYADFLDQHPDWPRLEAIRRRAESAIDGSIQTAERRAYFAIYPALSRNGRLRHIEALLVASQVDPAANLVKTVWIENGFNKREQQEFLRNYGQFLKAEDHSARLHRLLWDGRSTEAKRLFNLVSPGEQAIAIARIRLQQMAKGVDSAINRVPEAMLSDPGLQFDRLQWRRRKGRDPDARAILLDPPDQLVRPKLWWHERKRQINKLINERRFDEALILAEKHGQNDGLALAEALWYQGWLSLRFVDRPERAHASFEKLHDAVGSPISLGRAAYWAGRASDVLGEPAETERWYRKAANHRTSFYGQAAINELGVGFELPTAALPASQASPEPIELAPLIQLLCAIDARRQVMPFLRRLMHAHHSTEQVLELAKTCGRPEIYLELAKRGARYGQIDAAFSYPLPALSPLISPNLDRADPALVLAIARQESQFAVDARSPVGALGLMQLMPATAKETSRRMGLPFAEHRLRYDADYNVAIGSAYLDRLLGRYRGVEYLSVAAYNAGPGSVSRWIRNHGDPRRMSEHDRIDWLELIPYSETRNYVQRVMEGRNNYSAILQSGDGIHIRSNPRRGLLVPHPAPRPPILREAS